MFLNRFKYTTYSRHFTSHRVLEAIAGALQPSTPPCTPLHPRAPRTPRTPVTPRTPLTPHTLSYPLHPSHPLTPSYTLLHPLAPPYTPDAPLHHTHPHTPAHPVHPLTSPHRRAAAAPPGGRYLRRLRLWPQHLCAAAEGPWHGRGAQRCGPLTRTRTRTRTRTLTRTRTRTLTRPRSPRST